MPEITPSRYRVDAGWADIPHIPEATKKELLASTPPHLREARSLGVPSLGSGAIYPIARSEITVPMMPIPPHWPRAYGFDVGWHRTAAIWGAYDPETWILYLYSEHYRGEAEPSIHADAIRARGKWVPGVGDAAAASQADGVQMIALYRNQGLDLELADKAVDAGLHDVWSLLSAGRLKVMEHLANWFREYSNYHRDEKGSIVKKDDHLMDATRYLVRSGRARAKVRPVENQFGGDRAARDTSAGY